MTFSFDGLQARPVLVEADLRPGLPAFTIVGLADRSVSEARERVRAAILNSGFEFPMRRVTVNLAPAHLRKAGPGFDLAIACAVLAASGQLDASALAGAAVIGELSLGGEVRACRGALVVAEAARAAGLARLVVPRERVREARLVDGLRSCGIDALGQLASGLDELERQTEQLPELVEQGTGELPDLLDVRGHALAIEALTIAAAGGHNLLLNGAPGTGKTMLARRLPSVLPELDREEALEVTRIHSLAGLREDGGLARLRPFRAPHHTISASGLVGGGSVPTPGEATYAHRGVLFLDELSEFERRAIEALRQPLEDGEVAIVRGQRVDRFPTRFALVAATNPCPCGRGGSRCRCTEIELARHQRKLSGPLMDRLDLVVAVERPSADELAADPVTDSATVRDRVATARERQARRAGRTNAELATRGLRAMTLPTTAAEALLRRVYEHGTLSARGRDRALRVARTIADLAGCERVEPDHLRQALALRHDAELAGVPA